MTTPPKRLSIDTTALQDYEPAARDWDTLSLGMLAELYGTDKAPSKHGYTLTYERLFQGFRAVPRIRLLEVGVASGQSLKMWARYFGPTSRIVGIDIRPECAEMCRFYENVDIVIGDACDVVVGDYIGQYKGFDFIIDDGSHVAKDILHTWKNLWPRLVSGGIYVIEDLSCVWSKNYKPERGEDRDQRYLGELLCKLYEMSTKKQCRLETVGQLLIITKLTKGC